MSATSADEQVRAADGHVYSRGAIEAWFSTHDTSPMTNRPIANKKLIPVDSKGPEKLEDRSNLENKRIVPNFVVDSFRKRAVALQNKLQGNVKGHSRKDAKRKPKQTKKNFKQQKRHQNIKNAQINKAVAGGITFETWRDAIQRAASLVEEWCLVFRNIIDQGVPQGQEGSLSPSPGEDIWDKFERQRIRKVVDQLFGCLQLALQCGPLKHSKPCDFKRCQPTATAVAHVWTTLSRVCSASSCEPIHEQERQTILGNGPHADSYQDVDFQPEPSTLPHESSTTTASTQSSAIDGSFSDQCAFTTGQVRALLQWKTSLKLHIAVKTGETSAKRGVPPKADDVFCSSWEREKQGLTAYINAQRQETLRRAKPLLRRVSAVKGPRDSGSDKSAGKSAPEK